MDNKIMFSIYDTTTELYEPPFVDVNRGSALRRIQDLMKNHPDSMYAKFPEQFQLTVIGTWNEKVGDIISDKPVVFQELEDLKSKD
jgi:hypothetical protein